MTGMTDAVSPPWLGRLRGEVLRHIRAQGSTQAALAAHLGITPKHMSQVLTGRVNGSPEMIDRIAGAVGLRIALVAGEGEPVTLPPGGVAGKAETEPGRTGRGRKVIARVAEYAGYAVLMAGCMAAAVGWMFFWLVVVPDLAAAVRLAVRAVRALFLGVGWAVAVVRLFL